MKRLSFFALAAACTAIGTIVGTATAVLAPGISARGMPTSSLYVLPANPSFVDLLANNTLISILLVLGGGVLTGSTLFVAGVPLGVEIVRNPNVFLAIPHGIFEFPALWFAGAAGLRIPYLAIKYVRGSQESVFPQESLRKMQSCVLKSGTLLVVSAMVESTLTKWLAGQIAS